MWELWERQQLYSTKICGSLQEGEPGLLPAALHCRLPQPKLGSRGLLTPSPASISSSAQETSLWLGLSVSPLLSHCSSGCWKPYPAASLLVSVWEARGLGEARVKQFLTKSREPCHLGLLFGARHQLDSERRS